MIERLRGELLENRPPHLVVDVNGVGYGVEAPMSTVFALPHVGATVILLTHLQVREDAHTLFGFLTEAERELFRGLLKVNGVGARMALAILSTLTPSEFHGSVMAADVAALTRVPGVGKKTAERLIVEMRDRLGQFAAVSNGVTGIGVEQAGFELVSDPVSEAEAALVSLGYKPQEASRMVAKIDTDGLDLEAIIKQALKATLK